MKKLVAWAGAHILFFMGDCGYRLCSYRCIAWAMWPIHHWLLDWSVIVQDWGGATTPWRNMGEDK